MNDFVENEAFQRELERTYLKREKDKNEEGIQGIFAVVLEHKNGEKILAIVISGNDLEINTKKI